MNPTQVEVKEMEKDVDPNDTGSFDQISLISLIARRPKQIDDLEEMVQALKTIAISAGAEENDKSFPPITIESLKYSLTTLGEGVEEHEIEELLADCVDLIHEDAIQIDVLANYLMKR